eukprot:363471-Chlamydomonas_euryale.AAC.2
MQHQQPSRGQNASNASVGERARRRPTRARPARPAQPLGRTSHSPAALAVPRRPCACRSGPCAPTARAGGPPRRPRERSCLLRARRPGAFLRAPPRTPSEERGGACANAARLVSPGWRPAGGKPRAPRWRAAGRRSTRTLNLRPKHSPPLEPADLCGLPDAGAAAHNSGATQPLPLVRPAERVGRRQA